LQIAAAAAAAAAAPLRQIEKLRAI